MTKNPPTKAKPIAAAVVAAIAGTVDQVMMSPDLIVPSPTNPRKTFPEQSLQELAATMRTDGQIQAITVRPLPSSRLADTFANRGDGKPLPTHELVVGERRWRAATLGGMDLRCEIRELTDLQVVRIQIIENLHREEVHALEEAEGYEYLLHHSAEKITAEQVATEVGKSVSYVFQRMKLCDLCSDARKAFYDGEFDASTALLLARIPTADLQLKAIASIKEMSFGNEDRAPSYRQIRAMLRQRYHLQLSSASFDILDVELVPGCGSCAVCPKRTGNQPMLFEDVGNADVCTDPDCFDGKRKASVTRAIDQARAEGLQVLEGEEAKNVMRWPGSSYGMQGYTNLNDEAYEDEDGNSVTYADLVEKAGKKAPKTALLVHPDAPDSTPYKLLSDDAAEALLKKFAPKDAGPKKATSSTRETPEQAAARAAESRAYAVRRAYREQLQGALLARADKPRTHADMVVVLLGLIGDEISESVLEAAGVKLPADDETRDVDHEGALVQVFLAMSPQQVATFMMRVLFDGDLDTWVCASPIPALEAAALSHGLKPESLLKQAEKKVDADDEETEE